jgi:hypothetical protein
MGGALGASTTEPMFQLVDAFMLLTPISEHKNTRELKTQVVG